MTYMKHLYYGDGKGKTTAALGLALRAAGSGMKVHIVQFMKGSPTGELNALANIENITVARCDRDYGFSKDMSQSDKEEIYKCHTDNLMNSFRLMNNGEIQMLVLDEITDAHRLRLIDFSTVVYLNVHPFKAEIVMTGHDPSDIFFEHADYISEIRSVRHPFNNGIKARKGIEY